ncbi:TniQ family protein [Pseudaminobacter soli (ex Li et al. 2025)]|uniref:TniQ domain-containing protein n=1 Tax=Pseudaminobacter soli (ex Li et al. 2025) TaxID=1295366 RepID=A0A2P7RMI8_9HYPH|nr:TniQ family protein [Mesorhizobium soli]PSJ51433.1 hypothetical protein C7I85_29470 [Mesorhizobium soli]
MRLPIRFGPLPDEAFHQFMYRLAASNAYQTTQSIAALAGMPRGYALQPCDLGPLAALLGGMADAADLIARARWPVCEGSQFVRMGGNVVAARMVNVVRAKICPQCIRETGLDRAIWDLSLYVACSKHGTVLVDECSSCGHRLSWHRNAVDRCGCGCGKILLMEPARASQKVIAVMSELERRYASSTPEQDTDLGIELNAALELLWFTGTHDRNEPGWRSRFMSKPDIATSLRAIERSGDVLLHWPHGLHTWLEEHRVPSAEHVGIHADFGPVLTRMRHVIDIADPMHVFDEVRSYIANHGPVKPCSFFFSRQAKSRTVGAHAARRLGVTNATVKRMVRDGHLSGQCRRGGNRHFTAVDPQAIELAMARRASSIGVADLADQLGVSRYQVGKLRRSGLLCPLPAYVGRRECRFDRDAADMLEGQFRKAAKIAEISHVDTALKAIATKRQRQLAGLVKLVLEGTIPVQVIDGDQPLFERVFVPSNAVTWITALDVRSAAAKLKVSVRMIPVLVEAGCLSATRTQRNIIAQRSVDACSVAQFGDRYVLTGEVAARRKTSTRMALAELRAAKVKPVITSNSAAGISAVWRREDLQKTGVLGEA